MVIVRCRGIITYNNNLLVVKNTGKNFYTLPGGKVDPGETIDQCIQREIIEELGVKPEIGQIVFFQDFENNGKYAIDFFYTIMNGKDFLNVEKTKASHAYELEEIRRISLKDTTIKIMPKIILSTIENLQSLKNNGVQRLFS